MKIRCGSADAGEIFTAFDGHAVSGGDWLEALEAAIVLNENLEAYAAFVRDGAAEPGQSRHSV